MSGLPYGHICIDNDRIHQVLLMAMEDHTVIENIEESDVTKAIRKSMENTKTFLEGERNRLLPLRIQAERMGDLISAVYFGSRIEWLNTFMEMLDTGENPRVEVEKLAP